MKDSTADIDSYTDLPPAVWVRCLLPRVREFDLLPQDAQKVRETEARLKRNTSTRRDVATLKRVYREYRYFRLRRPTARWYG